MCVLQKLYVTLSSGSGSEHYSSFLTLSSIKANKMLLGLDIS